LARPVGCGCHELEALATVEKFYIVPNVRRYAVRQVMAGHGDSQPTDLLGYMADPLIACRHPGAEIGLHPYPKRRAPVSENLTVAKDRSVIFASN
jgi:hypothetical protein